MDHFGNRFYKIPQRKVNSHLQSTVFEIWTKRAPAIIVQLCESLIFTIDETAEKISVQL